MLSKKNLINHQELCGHDFPHFPFLYYLWLKMHCPQFRTEFSYMPHETREFNQLQYVTHSWGRRDKLFPFLKTSAPMSTGLQTFTISFLGWIIITILVSFWTFVLTLVDIDVIIDTTLRQSSHWPSSDSHWLADTGYLLIIVIFFHWDISYWLNLWSRMAITHV